MGRKENQSWQGGESHQDPSADDGEATDGESKQHGVASLQQSSPVLGIGEATA